MIDPSRPEAVVAEGTIRASAPDPARRYNYVYTERLPFDEDPGTAIVYPITRAFLIVRALLTLLPAIVLAAILLFITRYGSSA